MSLKTFNPKIAYDFNNYEDTLLEEFYIPALSESVSYKRVAGYFSSNALAAAAVGFKKYFENGGHKIELVCCAQLSEDDQRTIKEAIEQKEKEIIYEIENMGDVLKKGHLDILAWMIKYDKIEIKVAVVPLGIAHKKIGIFEDKEKNKISFSGSDNETLYAWLNNDEQFHVYSSWKDDKDHLKEDVEAFERLWGNTGTKAISYPISEAFKKNLIKNAPNKKEFATLSNDMVEAVKKIAREETQKIKKIRSIEGLRQKEKEEIDLWPSQETAIKEWDKNDRKGILRIATGCGKTIIGVSILKENLQNRAINLLISPKNEINSQWVQDFEKFLNIERMIITGKGNWKKDTHSVLSHYQNNRIESIVFVTTYDMLPKLVDILNSYNISSRNNLIIVDEAHSLGAEETSKIMDNDLFASNFPKRLGLSATPESIYNKERNDKLYNFLGKIILRYGIREGIRDRILCNYEYHIKIVKMTWEDYEKYLKLTKDLASLYYKTKNKDEKNKFYELLVNVRARIIKKSHSKFMEFEKILSDLKNKGDIGNTLVFGEDLEHLEKIYESIEKIGGINSSKIIGDTPPEQREKIFEDIKKGDLDIVTSTSILDEGISIKSLKNAIILSSSTNPRQYIQRRGRVLRYQKENPFKVAQIYDFFMIPPIFEKDNYDLDKTIIEKELKRIKEFIANSNNILETKWKNYELLKILKEFGLEKEFGVR